MTRHKCEKCKRPIFKDNPLSKLCKLHYFESIIIDFKPETDFLPRDCLYEISKYLDLQDYLNMILVNSYCYTLFTHPTFWTDSHYIHLMNHQKLTDKESWIDKKYKWNTHDTVFTYNNINIITLQPYKNFSLYDAYFYIYISNYQEFIYIQKLMTISNISIMCRCTTAYLVFYNYAFKRTLNTANKEELKSAEAINIFNSIFT